MQTSRFFNNDQNIKDKKQSCEVLSEYAEKSIDNNSEQLVQILIEHGVPEDITAQTVKESRDKIKEKLVEYFLERAKQQDQRSHPR